MCNWQQLLLLRARRPDGSRRRQSPDTPPHSHSIKTLRASVTLWQLPSMDRDPNIYVELLQYTVLNAQNYMSCKIRVTFVYKYYHSQDSTCICATESFTAWKLTFGRGTQDSYLPAEQGMVVSSPPVSKLLLKQQPRETPHFLCKWLSPSFRNCLQMTLCKSNRILVLRLPDSKLPTNYFHFVSLYRDSRYLSLPYPGTASMLRNKPRSRSVLMSLTEWYMTAILAPPSNECYTAYAGLRTSAWGSWPSFAWWLFPPLQAMSNKCTAQLFWTTPPTNKMESYLDGVSVCMWRRHSVHGEQKAAAGDEEEERKKY